MAEQITLYQRTQQLLSPKPCLYPKLFYDSNMMQEKVRQTLLIKALDVYNKVFASLPGVELEDIFLVGSTVSYHWREGSDFDVRILLKIYYDKFFIKNKKRASFILGKMLKEHLNKQRSYRYEERYLDLGVVLKPKFALYGAYSLLYNAWFMPPDRFLTSKLKADDIYEALINKMFDLQKLINVDLDSLNYQQRIKTLKNIRKQYNKKVSDSQLGNIVEFMVFKLLKYEKMRKEIIYFCHDNLLDILSIKGEE